MPTNPQSRGLKRWAIAVALLMLLTCAATGGYFFWDFYHVKPIPSHVVTLLPRWSWNNGTPSVSPVSADGGNAPLLAEVEYFHDELLAYLSFDFLRSQKALAGHKVYLAPTEEGPRVVYRLLVDAGDDWLSVYREFDRLRAEGLVRGWMIRQVAPEDLRRIEAETRVFVAAYNKPVQTKLESLSPRELREYARRFVIFKSRVDPRVRRQLEPRPEPINPAEADQLAADIITVADFYDLPLDVFLGIAAVENNYMDVRGDVDHGIWKRKAQQGDIVLKRGRRGVYVLNYATGVWQITRETLRFAHRMYLEDREKGPRDYSALPARLIPATPLYFDEVNSHWLTLYAGILMRHLIDHFHGDIEKAVGAYNGGAGNPNPSYEGHVAAAATHARRVLEQAAALHHEAIDDSGFEPVTRPQNAGEVSKAGEDTGSANE
ncbi:MAG: lytic transglycosylase domain-containing protein [Bryobacterales bacterium]|nr:lytic transglycosylase domain-containing protein [Bryobacterales bacterium]